MFSSLVWTFLRKTFPISLGSHQLKITTLVTNGPSMTNTRILNHCKDLY